MNTILKQKFKTNNLERKWKNSNKAKNPIAPNQADIVQWQLYDRQTTAANTVSSASYTFFNVPIGGTKTKVDTNLEQVSTLPAPQMMNVQSISFYFASSMIKTDIDSVLNNYWFEFWVSQKVYAEGPLQSAPSGYGLYGATTRNNEGAFQSGIPSGSMVQFNLVLPMGVGNGDGITGITILQSQNFYVKMIAGSTFTTSIATSPTNGTGLNIMCFLTGILSRGVQ